MTSLLKQIIRWGLCLFVFLIPWQARLIVQQGTLQGVPWEYGTVSIFVTEILLALLCIAGVVLHLKDFDDDHHFRNQKSYWMMVLLSVFVVISLVTAVFAIDVRTALLGALRLLEGVALVLLLRHAVVSLHRLAQCLVVSAALQGVIGSWQFFTQRIAGSTWLGVSEKLPQMQGISVIETATERVLRAYGTFGHPNILAGFLVIGLMCAVGLLLTQRSRREAVLTYGALVLISAGLFFTFSRMGIIVTLICAAALGVYLLVNRNHALLRVARDAALVLVAVMGLLSILYGDVVTNRYLSAEILATPSVQERVSLYETGRELAAQHWQRGVGIGNYTFAFVQAYPLLEGYEYQPVHNIYVLILVELGIGGLFVFLLFVGEMLKHITRFRVEYPVELLEELEKFQTADMYQEEYGYITHWYIILSSILIGLLVWGLADHFWWTLYPGILMFWLVIGLWMHVFVRVRR